MQRNSDTSLAAHLTQISVQKQEISNNWITVNHDIHVPEIVLRQ